MGPNWAYYWVEFLPETYISYTNPENGHSEKLKIIGARGLQSVNANNIENGGAKLSLGKKHTGIKNVALDFPAIPRGVLIINLEEKGGWSFKGIHINERADIEPVQIATTEEEIDSLIIASNSPITGIYEDLYSSYKLALISSPIYDNEIKYILVTLWEDKTFKIGEIRALLRPTTTNNVFKGDWINEKRFIKSTVITVEEGGLQMKFLKSDTTFYYVRMGTDNNKTNISTKKKEWSGTGYAIGNKYIVTNYHVVDEAKAIVVKGVGGNLNSNYSAEVVATDKVNDIAVLKITDSRFSGFEAISYNVTTRMADVGEDIFVLGYPLTQTMGNEIKLTNGIISSRTGFQGDVSLYQMSAPIQPGNSVGPMFDSKGNVIGILVAHHAGAENAGYAIKTSYLKNLIESAGLNISLPSGKNLSALSLSEKVKRVRNFVFLIECGK